MPPSTTTQAQLGTALLVALLTGCTSEKPPTCEDHAEAAEELLASNQRCNRDDECVVGATGGYCLGPFLCSAAIRRDTDLDELRRKAEEISAAFKESCVGCALADCADPSALRAACVDHLCAVRY